MQNIQDRFTPNQIDQFNPLGASSNLPMPPPRAQVSFLKSSEKLNPTNVDNFFIQEVGMHVYNGGSPSNACQLNLLNWVESPSIAPAPQIENNVPTDIESDIESRLRSVIRGNYFPAIDILNALKKMHSYGESNKDVRSNTFLVEYYKYEMNWAKDIIRCGLDKILNSREMVKIALRTTYYLLGEIKRGSDKVKATFYFMQAAELGCVRSPKTAEIKLAKEHGIGNEVALRYFRAQALSGDAAACYQLGQFVEKLGDEKDALFYYYRGTSGGDIPYRDMLERAELIEKKQKSNKQTAGLDEEFYRVKEDYEVLWAMEADPDFGHVVL